MRRYKPKANGVVYFKRTQVLVSNTNTTTDYFEGRDFQFNLLSNASEYSNLYQQYMLCGIKITWEFDVGTNTIYTTETTGTTVGVIRNTRPLLHTAIDHVDSTTPTSIDQLQQMQSYKKIRPGYTYSRYFTPTSLGMVYVSTTLTGYEPKYKQWCSMDYPNIDHFGLKWALEVGLNNVVSYRMLFTYYFKCKVTK